MEHRTEYKALVLKKRGHDGSYIFCHIGFKPGTNEPEFIHDGRPNLRPVESTLGDYFANYATVATPRFLVQFYAWHELVDCELVIKAPAASPEDTSL